MTDLVKQPRTDQPVDHPRLLDHFLRVFLRPVIPAPQARIDLDLLLDRVDFLIQHIKPRMLGGSVKLSYSMIAGGADKPSGLRSPQA